MVEENKEDNKQYRIKPASENRTLNPNFPVIKAGELRNKKKALSELRQIGKPGGAPKWEPSEHKGKSILAAKHDLKERINALESEQERYNQDKETIDKLRRSEAEKASERAKQEREAYNNRPEVKAQHEKNRAQHEKNRLGNEARGLKQEHELTSEVKADEAGKQAVAELPQRQEEALNEIKGEHAGQRIEATQEKRKASKEHAENLENIAQKEAEKRKQSRMIAQAGNAYTEAAGLGSKFSHYETDPEAVAERRTEYARAKGKQEELGAKRHELGENQRQAEREVNTANKYEKAEDVFNNAVKRSLESSKQERNNTDWQAEARKEAEDDKNRNTRKGLMG